MKRLNLRILTLFCIAFVLCVLSVSASALHYKVYYEASELHELEHIETYEGIGYYGDETEFFTVPEMPAYTDKRCWIAYSVRIVNDQVRSNQVIGWCYPGEKIEIGQDAYLMPDDAGVKTFDVYAGYYDGETWVDRVCTHTYANQGSYAPNRRWEFIYFYSPEKNEYPADFPQGTPFEELYWDFWIVPPDNHEPDTQSGAIRVGRITAGNGFALSEQDKEFSGRYWRNSLEWDPGFNRSTDFEGYDLLLVPVWSGVHPETDEKSDYRLFYDDKNHIQHELDVYYSADLDLDYFIIPSPEALGLAKDKYGREFDYWDLYEAYKDGNRYTYSDYWGSDDLIFDDAGKIYAISGNYYLVPSYSGDIPDSPDDPEIEDCDWGIWYNCGDYYNQFYVYGLKNGNFIFECGDWEDSSMTTVELYLPSDVDPEEIDVPPGKILAGWNVYGPVLYVEGDEDEEEYDDTLEIGGYLDSFLPGERLVYQGGFDLFIEPVWTDAPDNAPECSALSGIISGNDLGYEITAQASGYAVIIAARYTSEGRLDGTEILTVLLDKGKNSVKDAFPDFIKNGASYKIFAMKGLTFSPLCDSWNG